MLLSVEAVRDALYVSGSLDSTMIIFSGDKLYPFLRCYDLQDELVAVEWFNLDTMVSSVLKDNQEIITPISRFYFSTDNADDLVFLESPLTQHTDKIQIA